MFTYLISLVKATGNAVRVAVLFLWQMVKALTGFFGLSGSVAGLLLLLVGGALVHAVEYEELRPFVAALASGMAVVLAAVASFTQNLVARGLLIAAAGGFTIWFSWFTVKDLSDQLKGANDLAEMRRQRLEMTLDDLAKKYFNKLAEAEKGNAVAAIGYDILRERYKNGILSHNPPFRNAEFDPSRDMIDLLSKIVDADRNGHVLYVQGEIERALGHADLGSQRFYTYLELEKNRTRNGELGGEPCKNPQGFCRERTAWIFNLLARDFLQQGRKLKAARAPEAVYKEKLNEALKHACSSIKLFPNGFSQPPSTREVERSLFEELGKPLPGAAPQPGICLQEMG
jgi:hypothetical protein